ncbi:MAG: DmsC/YnfH family molybdoenzyme membrane anchor subunit [Verrucomicrobiota bacterium]
MLAPATSQLSSVSDELWVDGPNLVEQLVSDQQQLQTAVARFAEWHDRDVPELESHYRKLIPLEKPGPGEQFAFEVDVEACSGCKACVSACHSMNGLDDHETWRDVGNLVGGNEWDPIVQTITSACHHCAEPGCMDGCPVLAYDKDEVTGIVRHLDDQCIGCQYCVLKCPYDVPKYSESRGIVRKCDMCHERLSVGEAPACVQACPNEAIRIIKVDQDEVKSAATSHPDGFMAGTADYSYTIPTTRFLKAVTPADSSESKAPEFADVSRLRVEPSHFPLVVMLVLTQAAAGCFVAAQMAWLKGLEVVWLLAAGTALAGLGIQAAMLHLGRPMKAWRAFLGWRKSWLSREIISFGALVPMAIALSGLALLEMTAWSEWVPVAEWKLMSYGLPWLLVLAFASVWTSVMVYADTQRPFWSLPRTTFKFYGTILVLAGAAGLAATGYTPFMVLALVSLGVKLAAEWVFLHRRNQSRKGMLNQSAHLMWGPLRAVTAARFALAVMGAVLLPVQPWAGVACLVLSEGCERYLFFRAVVAWRMPGV